MTRAETRASDRDHPNRAAPASPDREPTTILLRLYDEMAATTERIGLEFPWWPCRRGCSDCCYLMAAPVVTEAEWEHALPYVQSLPSALRRAFVDRASRFGADPARQKPDGRCACPFLENEACAIYPVRPAACRAFGMYVYRESGHWCGLVDAALADHADERDSITFGNIAPVHRVLDRLGSPVVSLPAWLERHADDVLGAKGD